MYVATVVRWTDATRPADWPAVNFGYKELVSGHIVDALPMFFPVLMFLLLFLCICYYHLWCSYFSRRHLSPLFQSSFFSTVRWFSGDFIYVSAYPWVCETLGSSLSVLFVRASSICSDVAPPLNPSSSFLMNVATRKSFTLRQHVIFAATTVPFALLRNSCTDSRLPKFTNAQTNRQTRRRIDTHAHMLDLVVRHQK